MTGVFKRFGLIVNEKKVIGSATISAYRFSNKEDPLYNLRIVRNSGAEFFMLDGNYISLSINNELVMSDTRMEKNSNMEFVSKAKGRVFIAGLGIGLILHNLVEKVNNGEVTEIVVMEKEQDVIDLISPFFRDLPIKYILDDVFYYLPPKNDKFDTIYFDVWSVLDTNNLKEMSMLHNRWKYRKNKDGWIGSWKQKFLQNKKRKENY